MLDLAKKNIPNAVILLRYMLTVSKFSFSILIASGLYVQLE